MFDQNDDRDRPLLRHGIYGPQFYKMQICKRTYVCIYFQTHWDHVKACGAHLFCMFS